MKTIIQTLREAVEYDIDTTEGWKQAMSLDWTDGDVFVERGWIDLPEFEQEILEAFLTWNEKWKNDFSTLQGDFFILLVAEALESEFEP